MSEINSEEKEILEAFESGRLKRIKNVAKEIEQHRVAAEETFKKNARIDVHLSFRDLRELQAQALKEGIPYQILVSNVLHKFVKGQLVDKAANK